MKNVWRIMGERKSRKLEIQENKDLIDDIKNGLSYKELQYKYTISWGALRRYAALGLIPNIKARDYNINKEEN